MSAYLDLAGQLMSSISLGALEDQVFSASRRQALLANQSDTPSI